jgi:hypothetical protein
MATESISVTQSDLEALGAKLDKADLTDNDRKLLVAAFAAAGRAVSAEAENDVSGYTLSGLPQSSFGTTSLRSGLSSGFGGSLSSGLRGDLANKAIIISVGF